MKVSFDFDNTLSRLDVQQYASELLSRGIEVFICTARFDPEHAPRYDWNEDLFLVSDSLGIKRENIIFCGMSDKYEFLKDKDFVFHIDDDNIELSFIRTETNIKPIFLFANKEWKSDCEKAICESLN